MLTKPMLTKGRHKRVIARQVDGKGSCLFTMDNFHAGDVIGYYEGPETTMDTMHSVHFEGIKIEGTGILKNLAHSCDPNAHFKDRGRWLYALKDIQAGAEVTIDYLNTEPLISAPFICRCGSSNCRGKIG